MNIKCMECGKGAAVVKIDGCNLYCQCSNANCAHHFFISQTFKRSISSTTQIGYLHGDRIICDCGGRTACYKNNRLTDKINDNYYQCVDCSHKFVMIRVYHQMESLDRSA